MQTQYQDEQLPQQGRIDAVWRTSRSPSLPPWIRCFRIAMPWRSFAAFCAFLNWTSAIKSEPGGALRAPSHLALSCSCL